MKNTRTTTGLADPEPKSNPTLDIARLQDDHGGGFEGFAHTGIARLESNEGDDVADLLDRSGAAEGSEEEPRSNAAEEEALATGYRQELVVRLDRLERQLVSLSETKGRLDLEKLALTAQLREAGIVLAGGMFLGAVIVGATLSAAFDSDPAPIALVPLWVVASTPVVFVLVVLVRYRVVYASAAVSYLAELGEELSAEIRRVHEERGLNADLVYSLSAQPGSRAPGTVKS